MPLPGALISVLEDKVQPLVDAMSQQSEKVRPPSWRHGAPDAWCSLCPVSMPLESGAVR